MKGKINLRNMAVIYLTPCKTIPGTPIVIAVKTRPVGFMFKLIGGLCDEK